LPCLVRSAVPPCQFCNHVRRGSWCPVALARSSGFQRFVLVSTEDINQRFRVHRAHMPQRFQLSLRFQLYCVLRGPSPGRLDSLCSLSSHDSSQYGTQSQTHVCHDSTYIVHATTKTTQTMLILDTVYRSTSRELCHPRAWFLAVPFTWRLSVTVYSIVCLWRIRNIVYTVLYAVGLFRLVFFCLRHTWAVLPESIAIWEKVSKV
jgi:hypothetical protein